MSGSRRELNLGQAEGKILINHSLRTTQTTIKVETDKESEKHSPIITNCVCSLVISQHRSSIIGIPAHFEC